MKRCISYRLWPSWCILVWVRSNLDYIRALFTRYPLIVCTQFVMSNTEVLISKPLKVWKPICATFQSMSMIMYQCYRPWYLVLNDVIHISIQLWQDFIILNRNLINYRVNTVLKQNAVKTRVSSHFNYLQVCNRHTVSTMSTTQNNYIIICGWTLPNKRQISFLPEGNWFQPL